MPALPPPPTDAPIRFVHALARGAFDEAAALVSPPVAADAMSAPRLALVWSRLSGQLGDLRSLGAPDASRHEGSDVADFAARFDRAEVTLRVVLDDTGRVAGFWVTPPHAPAYEAPGYVDAARFREIELVVGAEPALGATATLPIDGRAWPVAVLVHGSGPNDRDERLGGNRPFRDIAWGLATRGIAVLRYDKRTHAHPADLAGRELTLDVETIDDALAALDSARALDGVDPARVVLVGHSLGATFAPDIARRDGAVAGVVMLAPAGRSVGEVLDGQISHLVAVAVAAGESVDGFEGARELAAGLSARTLAPETPVLGAPARYWYHLDDRRPLEVARRLAVPALALFGGRDYQVTSADAALWREALAENAAAEVHELPTLDHLFRAGEGMATPADYLVRPGHVAGEVVDLVAEWIASRAPVGSLR